APYAAVVLAVFAAGAAVVLRQAARHLAGREFGAANRLTLARAALAALCGGLLLARPGAAVAWFAVAAALLALVLDGFDGSLARRRGLASAFGARFDMEIDALTILIMSALAWRFERAGVWVLASGLARYAFVAAGSVWPWLRQPLPASRRRQTVCVVQAGALVACLAPIVPPRLAACAAAIGLAALAASFAADIVGLWRAAHPAARLKALQP
ncbi:MAG TPA: CDP-alcohol phosphatidyltransferase family protein, partial [Gammaproteobacteria bacterium]|nr:CDP-alcohol phosphatidyltransferase family protein [Gammaproteobacteria bacterium]